MARQGIFIGLLAVLALLMSCIEDNLEFPEDQNPDIKESTALVSLLNHLKSNRRIDCFELVYPITLGFNNDITIAIENEAGLREAAVNQSAGLHISQVVFPLLVTKSSQISSIASDQQLFELLQSCDLPTLRSSIDLTHKQCFSFSYPLDMVNAQGDTTTLSSLDDFLTFYYSDQPANYQPNFAFPLGVQKLADKTQISIHNVYELYQLMNRCEPCPQLFFERSELDNRQFRFTASITGAREFDWYVDDVFIKTGTPDDNVLVKGLDPGTHEVCIKAASVDCVLGEVYCEKFEVVDPCPSMFFELQQINDAKYEFKAEFEGMLDLDFYYWTINGAIKDEEGLLNPSSDHAFSYAFDPGEYEVCIFTETPECPKGASYCKHITVPCADLSFSAEEEFTGYIFTADFEQRNHTKYLWTAYVRDSLVQEQRYEPGTSTTHDFVVQMAPRTEYLICLKQDGNCADEKECDTFIIGN